MSELIKVICSSFWTWLGIYIYIVTILGMIGQMIIQSKKINKK